MSKIVVIAGLAESLIRFRGDLLDAMRANGHEVTAIAPEQDDSVRERLAEKGITYHVVPMVRAGLNPLADLRYLLKLSWYLRRLKPDVVLAYTIKPVVYGLFAARLARVQRRYALITGLGYAFTDVETSFSRRLVNRIASGLYRFGLHFADGLFFQNPDDRQLFKNQGLVKTDLPTWIVNGSGVDTKSFPVQPLPPQPSFLFVGRLLRDKGVIEYVEAARTLKTTFPQATFHLVGPLDSNPSGINAGIVANWEKERIIRYHGSVSDVKPYLAACSVFVLPSYREGTPRSVLEAMSSGRAIITTDAPGCRETVQNGINGMLVKPRDSADLAKAMTCLAGSSDLREQMGRTSRKLAEEKYDVHQVNTFMIEKMQLHN
ncbi:glycosyltransferase family 4 protein [Pseudomonas chlororaphis subsp. aurantiaca]|uniref:glycosyltransferase family 4 protein n=1 Tax=Pseudomonas chlororaphis TaxID=587753 RepID=UPI0027DD739D|nr:glycosyltransferase family 4 protein [Pseudomonas chlororaphis]WMI98304.1 glycosyltransferase family 4 protein [Pseudomonas chlororaphis subsp. aurantiaca]